MKYTEIPQRKCWKWKTSSIIQKTMTLKSLAMMMMFILRSMTTYAGASSKKGLFISTRFLPIAVNYMN